MSDAPVLSVTSQRAVPESELDGLEEAANEPLVGERLSRLARLRPLLSVASVIAVLGAWQVCASTGAVDERLTSSPWGVVQAARFLVSTGALGSDVAASAELFAIGLAIAIAVGLVAGIAIGWWRTLGALFEPWIAILYAMPLISLLPLILVWFGVSFRAEVIIVFLVSVFPVLVGVLTGTRNVDPELIRLARSFRARERDIMRTVVLPSLVPYVVAGVRLSIGASLIGVVIAEYFLGNQGIGGLIVTAGDQLQPGEVLVGVAILAIASVIMTSLLRRAERRALRWRGA